MAGNSSIQGDQTVTFTDNMSFDGTDRGGAMTTDGQLWIGATASNRANNGGHVRLGSITSSDGSINVLNGAGTIDIRGQAAGFQPNAVVQLFDDFIPQAGLGSSNPGQMLWDKLGTVAYVDTSSVDHPGIIEIGDAANSGIFLRTSTAQDSFVLGGGVFTQSFNLDLAALSVAGNRYTARIGLTDDVTGGAIANGVYFTYTDNVNSGNFVLNCTAGSATTSTNTVVPPTTGFHTYTIVVNAGATSVSFYFDGALLGTVAANIPTLVINPYFLMVRSTGALPAAQVDLWWLTQALSNPRPGPLSPTTTGTDGRLLLSYTATAISYQVLGTDAIIGVTSTAAARTITMPIINVQVGQLWTIKDESGAASGFNITVSGNGFLIDGAANFVINTNYGSVSIYWSGSNFYVV